MGLRSEIREELEEQEAQATQAENEKCHTNDDDSDNEFHGIGHNILYNKFIGNDF